MMKAKIAKNEIDINKQSKKVTYEELDNLIRKPICTGAEYMRQLLAIELKFRMDCGKAFKNLTQEKINKIAIKIASDDEVNNIIQTKINKYIREYLKEGDA